MGLAGREYMTQCYHRARAIGKADRLTDSLRLGRVWKIGLNPHALGFIQGWDQG